jgi:hypothetical protein
MSDAKRCCDHLSDPTEAVKLLVQAALTFPATMQFAHFKVNPVEFGTLLG